MVGDAGEGQAPPGEVHYVEPAWNSVVLLGGVIWVAFSKCDGRALGHVTHRKDLGNLPLKDQGVSGEGAGGGGDISKALQRST
jgi:hypothetical protein